MNVSSINPLQQNNVVVFKQPAAFWEDITSKLQDSQKRFFSQDQHYVIAMLICAVVMASLLAICLLTASPAAIMIPTRQGQWLVNVCFYAVFSGAFIPALAATDKLFYYIKG